MGFLEKLSFFEKIGFSENLHDRGNFFLGFRHKCQISIFRQNRRQPIFKIFFFFERLPAQFLAKLFLNLIFWPFFRKKSIFLPENPEIAKSKNLKMTLPNNLQPHFDIGIDRGNRMQAGGCGIFFCFVHFCPIETNCSFSKEISHFKDYLINKI